MLASVPASIRAVIAGLLLAVIMVVFDAPERATQAAFPGLNGRIAFAVQAGEQRHIWTMEPNGSDRQQITTGAVKHYAPRF